MRFCQNTVGVKFMYEGKKQKNNIFNNIFKQNKTEWNIWFELKMELYSFFII